MSSGPPVQAWTPPPWESQTWTPPATTVAVVPSTPDQSGRPSTAIGIGTALAAIALSGLMTLVSHHVGPDLHRTVLRALEIGVALTVGLYVVVGALALQVVRSTGVRLRWVCGRWPLAIVVGVFAGGGIGALLLLHTQAVTGHVVIDSGLSLQLSEDTWWAVVLTMLMLVVAAPVVEETIFRGLLAESFLGSGLLAAVAVSAPAFWLWHWRPSIEAFVLLAGAGAVFAVVFRYHGLLGSMAAHATYNGILVAVVVTQLAGPGHDYQLGGAGLHAPQAWRAVTSSPDRIVLLGPSAATFEAETRLLDHAPQTAELTQQLQDGARALRLVGQISAGPVTPVSLPFGDGVQMTITAGAHHATLVEFADGARLFAIETDDEGSATAARQARQIVASFSFGS